MLRNLKINFFHVHQTNLEQNYFDCLILTEFNRSDRTWIFSWSKMGVTNKFHLCGARFNAYNGRHCLSATVVEWMAMKPERVLSYMSLLPFLSFYSYLPIKKSQIDMNWFRHNLWSKNKVLCTYRAWAPTIINCGTVGFIFDVCRLS